MLSVFGAIGSCSASKHVLVVWAVLLLGLVNDFRSFAELNCQLVPFFSGISPGDRLGKMLNPWAISRLV